MSKSKSKKNKNEIIISEGGSSKGNLTLPKYIASVINIPTTIKSIFEYDPTIKFSSNIDYPLFSLGFQFYIHGTKKEANVLEKFEGKKKVYYVMNEFEKNVDNYDENIGEVTKKFLKTDVVSREFFKLWEMLFMFDLIDLDNNKFVSVHIAEGPGSFIQATNLFRETFGKSNIAKNDKYYTVTLNSQNKDDYVPEIDKKLISHHEKDSPKRLFIHKTYSTQVAGGLKDKDNGDITDPKTIKLFGGEIKEKADFITADGGFKWKEEHLQEQEAFNLILAEICTAIKMQKKGGSFICKFFETFTLTSTKFISMLASVYNKVFIVKPLMSRPSNSEKYLVCLDFKYAESDKHLKDIIKSIDTLLKTAHENKNKK